MTQSGCVKIPYIVLILPNPTQIQIPKTINPQLLNQIRTHLTYIDSKITFEIQRLKRNSQWYSEESFDEKLNELKNQSKRTLLYETNDYYWTYSGILNYLTEKTNLPIQRNYSYPEPKLLPWAKEPEFTLYEHQKQSIDKLLEVKHAAISLPTGSGKSAVIIELVKRLGLPTIVMTPSTSISEQLYSEFVTRFGKKYVGRFFDSKKEVDKLIVVANAQSLTRIETDSPIWTALSKFQAFISDESHTVPASTYEKVCHGILKYVPYRFFVSATQLRNDGSDILLDCITGPVVYEASFREMVDKKVLSKPTFRMYFAPCNGDYSSKDVNKMTRKHLFYNPAVIEHVAKLCNLSVRSGMQTLVLIEEIEQFGKLLPYLRIPAFFAHGTLNDDNRQSIPQEYWDSEPNELVRQFNDKKFPLLVGTSCISMGTDVKSVQFLIYWQGGKSEIQVKQAIGRGTRIFPGKTTCHIIDYWVKSPIGHRLRNGDGSRWTLGAHAQERKKIYDDLYGPVHEDDVLQ